MKRNNVDWIDIKAAYIFAEYEMSVRELADKFGVGKTQVHERMVEENWVEKREEHNNKLLQKLEDYIVIDKISSAKRSLVMINSIIETAGSRLLKRLMVGDINLTLPNLMKLIELEKKMLSNTIDSPKKSKKLNKTLSECTSEELIKIASGEYVPLDEIEEAILVKED